MFLIIVFLLGLLWGWIMQRTGSVLAPALFHAGVDMLIIADAFAAFGIRG
jgi:membrane protease YdiL (CAAX protease family)